MKKQQAPIVVGLVVIIVVAVGFILWQMRPRAPAGTTADASQPAATGQPGGQGQIGGQPPSPSAQDEARARGQFTPAPK